MPVKNAQPATEYLPMDSIDLEAALYRAPADAPANAELKVSSDLKVLIKPLNITSSKDCPRDHKGSPWAETETRIFSDSTGFYL